MPRGDGTGPGGEGPMTGWGIGYCTGYANPTYFGIGRGIRRGIGRGRGFGMGFGSPPGPGLGIGRGRMPIGYSENPYQPPTREQELAALNNDKKEIETQLGGIEKRMKELSK